jgi:hypothetical protein
MNRVQFATRLAEFVTAAEAREFGGVDVLAETLH